MDEEIMNEVLGFDSKPRIKLIKNTKGYNWEISIPSLDTTELDRINLLMIERYGSKAE